MKTIALTLIAAALALSAHAQTVMRENSIVYYQTNVFLHDDAVNPLHQRISVEGQEPLWVAASNQVVYYLGGEITNARVHAMYLYCTNATLIEPVIESAKIGGVTRTNWPNDGITAETATNIAQAVVDATPYVAYDDFGSTISVEIGSVAKPGVIVLAQPGANAPVGILAANSNIYSSGKAAWSFAGETNVWQGRVNDTEAARIAEMPTQMIIFNATSWIQSDGTNLFFVSTVSPGFTNALTTNVP